MAKERKINIDGLKEKWEPFNQNRKKLIAS